MLRIVFTIGAALAAMLSASANTNAEGNAENNFSLTLTPGTFYGHYHQSEYRDQIQGKSVYVEGRDTSHWGFSAGYEQSRIKYKYSIADYTQTAGYLSGHVSYLPNGARGFYSFRLGLHSIRDNDYIRSGDDVRVIASQFSYERINHSIYLDLGYTLSRYESSSFTPGSLKVQQWTPTLGFALTHGATNWVKFRGYFILSSDPIRSQLIKNTGALEVKYFYYPSSPYKLIPQNITLSALSGYRIYAVDRDTSSVSNVADLEKGGIAITATWRLTNSVHLVYSQGRSKFRELASSGYNDYTENVAWLGLSALW